MALIAREKSDYIPIPEGTHRAVSSAVIDLGIQENPYGKPKPQLLIRFEFPDLRNEREEGGPDDQPRPSSPSIGQHTEKRLCQHSGQRRN